MNTKAVPLTNNSARPAIVYWAGLGALILAFQIYVLGRWITGPNFVATVPTDALPAWQETYFFCLQILVPLACLAMFWHWLIRPWLRDGQMSTDGRLLAAFSMIFFWDMSMNYSSTVLYYNSHLINRGSWNLGSWPSWLSPNANVLPEPIFVAIPGYTALVFSQVLFVCWLLRLAKTRKPDLSLPAVIGLAILGLTIVDSLIEIFLLRTGVYAYPGAIHAVTLFAGETYQFPLTEGFLFGGLGCGATALLSFYRDDNGLTWVERGYERLKFGQRGKSLVRFLAVFGFVHGMFFLLYSVPNQWISLNTDPFPEGYPSYLENGMCVYGVNADECPGPGVMMPRPPYLDLPATAQ